MNSKYLRSINRYEIRSVVDILASLSLSLIFITIRVYYLLSLFSTVITINFDSQFQHRLYFSLFSNMIGAKHSKLALFHTSSLLSEQAPTCKCLAYNPLISWFAYEVFRYKTRWPLHRSDNLQRVVNHNQIR